MPESLPDQSATPLSAFLATGEGYRAIRRAIADPGAVVRRKVEGRPYLYRDEDLTDWQTRAVMAALGRGANNAATDESRRFPMPESLPEHSARALAAMADAIKHDPDDDDWVVWITPSDAAARALRGAQDAGFRLTLDEQQR